MTQDNSERDRKASDYRSLISRMLGQIQDEIFLRRIYIIISDYVKEKPE